MMFNKCRYLFVACLAFAYSSVCLGGAEPLGGGSSDSSNLVDMVNEAMNDGFVPNSSSSSLWNNCGNSDYACGECETELQEDFNDYLKSIVSPGDDASEGDRWSELDFGEGASVSADISLEEAIAQISEIFRENNTNAPGELNYVVIGESESLQETRPGYPRIALKSPDSELWVTFNTDPELPGYNALEIMRWDGQKGEYLFQEVTFASEDDAGDVRPGHVDLSGQRCMECHTDEMRPNWDTYRAWPGIIPPRDDMLESVEVSRSGDRDELLNYMSEFRDEGASGETPDPSAMAYFDFLDRLADAKESETPNRLSVLDVPFDSRQVLPDYQNASTDREKIEAIQRTLEQRGSYRIPHYPPTFDNQNRDSKTAQLAGPSHISFDQLMGQNMCKITTRLSEHPQFDQFKYALAGMIKCKDNIRSFEDAQEYFPSWVSNQSDHFFHENPEYLSDITGTTPIDDDPTNQTAVYDAIYQNTEASHIRANLNKEDREFRFLSRYMEDIEGASPEVSERLARHIASEKETPMLSGYHAIDDPGGVRGVAEDSTEALTNLRYVLEPFGVNVRNWSMSIGRNIADRGYSFSDQFFPLIGGERVILDVYEEAGGNCNRLAEMSREAFSDPYWKGQPPAPDQVEILPLENACLTLMFETRELEDLNNLTRPVVNEMIRSEGQQLFQSCASCHHSESGFKPFRGLSLNGELDESEFGEFLRDNDLGGEGFRNVDMILNAIGVKHLSENPDERSHLHRAMPPGGFQITDDDIRRYGRERRDIDQQQRELLGVYLDNLSNPGSDRRELRRICRGIISDSAREFMGEMDSFDLNLIDHKGSGEER